MSILTANAGAMLNELEVTGVNLPLYILLPLIMVIGIVAVVGIRWLNKKINKSDRSEV